MWSAAVTFGGGIIITYGSAAASASTWNSPRSSQRAYRAASIPVGS
jgi:hypothetical protein